VSELFVQPQRYVVIIEMLTREKEREREREMFIDNQEVTEGR
jgi:hypothetical protein